MDYLALYRKYRPKELDEVVGQSEIKKILASSIKNGTITHAYLFSGPRGTGKTTMAKILAKMVNCLSPVDGNACNKCESCKNILDSNDVIEIDAASNNGVDEIRDLREKANLVPTSAKYKVYIIDEVHMLTTQAFNALLKTLEEPPKHVIFILATTEYYKIPLTITSRCQKFQFSKLTNDDIFNRLKEIAKKEKIKITDEAMMEIAKISDGGMRDSINFLDQLRSFNSNEITIDDVYEVCGNVSSEEIYNLLVAIRENNFEKVTAFFENMDTNGKNYTKFLESFVSFLKDLILFNKNVNHKYIKNNIEILDKVDDIFGSDEIFTIIESVNELIESLKFVSRQSIIVITKFLLIINKLNAEITRDKIEKETDDDSKKDYDMAFEFTSNNENKEVNDIDNGSKLTELEEKNTEEINKENISYNKEIIVNNTFATANKEIKNRLQEVLTSITEYLTDKKYQVAAGTLTDVKVEVAGEEYIIFSAPNEAVVEKIFNNYQLCSELIEKILNKKYTFVILNNEEWNKCRDEYVKNFKNGVKYTLKEMPTSAEKKKVSKKKNTVVDKLFELVGEENVEFK